MAQYRLDYPNCLIEPAFRESEPRHSEPWIRCHDCPQKLWHPSEQNFTRHLSSTKHITNQNARLEKQQADKERSDQEALEDRRILFAPINFEPRYAPETST